MSVGRRLSKWIGSDCLIILTKLDRYLLIYMRISSWSASIFYGKLTRYSYKPNMQSQVALFEF